MQSHQDYYDRLKTRVEENQHSEEEKDGEEESEQQLNTAEEVFIRAFAKEVKKKLMKERDEDTEWNLTVLDNFNDAFESTSVNRVWRRFMLMLHYKNPTISEEIIDELCKSHERYRSHILSDLINDTASETSSNVSDESSDAGSDVTSDVSSDAASSTSSESEPDSVSQMDRDSDVDKNY